MKHEIKWQFSNFWSQYTVWEIHFLHPSMQLTHFFLDGDLCIDVYTSDGVRRVYPGILHDGLKQSHEFYRFGQRAMYFGWYFTRYFECSLYSARLEEYKDKSGRCTCEWHVCY